MLNLTTKALTWGLGSLALASGAFAGLQTYRLGNAQDQVTSLQTSVDAEKGRADLAVTVANQRGEELRARDQLLQDQSASIDALRAQSDAARATYQAGIRAADAVARSNESRAAELIRAPVQVPDDRCEAARALLEEEMLNVR
jgi:hypothetical protein